MDDSHERRAFEYVRRYSEIVARGGDHAGDSEEEMREVLIDALAAYYRSNPYERAMDAARHALAIGTAEDVPPDDLALLGDAHDALERVVRQRRQSKLKITPHTVEQRLGDLERNVYKHALARFEGIEQRLAELAPREHQHHPDDLNDARR